MPVWLQISLPVFTAMLGSALTLAVQRINKNLDRKQERKDTETADAARRPSFAIHRGDKAILYLVNEGDADATGVRLDRNGYPEKLLRYLPDGVALPRGQKHKFLIQRVAVSPPLSHFFVSCEQFDEPQQVSVPD